MASLFSKIIAGEIPARFIWQDEHTVAFMDIAPLRPGHTLVVPREEVDLWTDASAEVLNRVMAVAQKIGQAQREVFGSKRAGLSVIGFDVPHIHVHVWPVNSIADYDFSTVDHSPDPAALDAHAAALRAKLRDLGYSQTVPAE